MEVPQCVDAPGAGTAHDAKGLHVIVVMVLITVIVLACADVSPEWLSGAAALVGVLASKAQRG
ncbi:hypothetical protein IOD14_20750 [Streptomyces sp. A2-16]|uniref:hypothetical protein n=1 Tax=Streptomyces sp. A2-16 TaxID=2781734 RepID=UPI001BAF2D8C|nr:hypothetical protein [Streptomyces sp. A2-16]QUC59016.1 hypothetical protein IOD14_20750 [Streptomyces sp. A2-16]